VPLGGFAAQDNPADVRTAIQGMPHCTVGEVQREREASGLIGSAKTFRPHHLYAK